MWSEVLWVGGEKGGEKGLHGIWAEAGKMGKREECTGCVGNGHPERCACWETWAGSLEERQSLIILHSTKISGTSSMC